MVMVFDTDDVDDIGLDFEFQIGKDQFELIQNSFVVDKNIEVYGLLTRVGDDFYLKGKVKTALTIDCSRCLSPLHRVVDGSLKARFIPSDACSAPVGETELQASDIDTEVYKDNKIDLTQSVLDGIMLTVPTVCLCIDGCRGICPHCGINLNREYCRCDKEIIIDPRLEILKTLKEKLK